MLNRSVRPAPRRPITPMDCDSSRINRYLNFFLSSTNRFKGAISPWFAERPSETMKRRVKRLLCYTRWRVSHHPLHILVGSLRLTIKSSDLMSSNTRSKSSMSLCLNQRMLDRDICTPFWVAKLMPSSLERTVCEYWFVVSYTKTANLHHQEITTFRKGRDHGRNGGEALSIDNGFFRAQERRNVPFQIHVYIDCPVEPRRTTRSHAIVLQRIDGFLPNGIRSHQVQMVAGRQIHHGFGMAGYFGLDPLRTDDLRCLFQIQPIKAREFRGQRFRLPFFDQIVHFL